MNYMPFINDEIMVQMKTTIPLFQKNHAGRDFVVGDIHGAFPLLYAAMKAAEFNPEVDRLFSLGDLIDRGSDSVGAIEFLARPYVHAIMGNHEEAFLSVFSGVDPEYGILASHGVRKYFADNFKGKWIYNASNEDIALMTKAFLKLPVAMEVETDTGLIGLVHGDVPGDDWGEFTESLRWGDHKAIKTALCSRKRVTRAKSSIIAGIACVFIGHTVVPSVQELGNVFAIDTGAAYREAKGGNANERLTLINMSSAGYSHIIPRKIKSDDFVVYL